ncbi:MAG TPA: putative quinol monooxygenase [Caulobacteraceae bacterium]|jgi:quinol monooxygenase YgiN|nr:putative quinol monooxygenase [Caulobacteraceae bacterium]
MIGIVATLKIQDGKAAEFEAAFKEAMDAVRANEPGNLFYSLVKSRAEPNTYKVLEGYKDEAAIAAHRDSAHYKALGPKLGPCIAGRPEIELYDGI